ncbi:MAG: glycosyltransferase family 2 protein [Lachnospiraceae bacterium]
MEKKVKVLLSAYNGEAYIAQQIDSILAQTYPNVELYVRDDGSTDGTLQVLTPYEDRGQIHLERGKNLGFAKSFFTLIEHCGDADYFAFSDQDDVWFPDKLKMAVEKLEQTDETKPVLYFSNFDYYDGDLNFLYHHDAKQPKISFRNSLVDCASLGFNSVFNRTAREMTIEKMPQKSTGHDWWMYMLCSGLGEVVYDSRPTVKYRRHEENVSGGEHHFIQFQIWRFKRFFLNHYFHKIHLQIQEFEKLHGTELSKEHQKEIAMFTKDGFHPLTALKKVCYPKYFRQHMIDEIFIRIIFLIGQL